MGDDRHRRGEEFSDGFDDYVPEVRGHDPALADYLARRATFVKPLA